MVTSEQPRWLSSDEMAAWLALVGVFIRLPAALDAQLQRDAGISHFEYQVLAMLSQAPDRALRMSELAGITNASLSRLSHVVTRLEKRGWARRRADPEDRRYTRAQLTDAGWGKVVQTAPGHVEAVRTHVFDPLEADQVGQLREIGRRILRSIDPEDRFLS